MGHQVANPGFWLMVTGAVAGIALAMVGRRLPHRLAATAAVLAIAAAILASPDRFSHGILYLAAVVIGLLATSAGLDGGLLGMYALVLTPTLGWMAQPVRTFDRTVYPFLDDSQTAILDSTYWSLIRVVTVCAVLSAAPRLRLSGAALRLREKFEGPWPSGLRAIVITLIAVCCFGGTVALGYFASQPGRLAAQIALVAAIALLRMIRPSVVSWGAWITAVITFTVLLVGIVLLFQHILPTSAYTVATIVAYLIAGILLVAGPRSARRARLAWCVYVLVCVLPVLGMLLGALRG